MCAKLHKILITGGAGFIGSALVRLLAKKGQQVIVVDKLTYAGDLKRLDEVRSRYAFYKCDICDEKRIELIFKKEKPRVVINFSAETHVDKSILDSKAFLQTNIIGTQVLLDISRKYGIERLIHISTDETYGDIKKGKFREDSPLKPNSPYAASKAAADLLIRSYIKTHNFPAVIIRPSNNYGPWQYPEKFIPVIIYKALRNQRVPIYANGLNVREWFYVSDCAEAILLILNKGKLGEIYNISSGHERKNFDTAKRILDILGRPHNLIEFVADRPGHDFRYALDSSKIRKLGWGPKVTFESGIAETVKWYRQNLAWLDNKVKYLGGYWEKVYKPSR